jgi:hypothetical protein
LQSADRVGRRRAGGHGRDLPGGKHLNGMRYCTSFSLECIMPIALITDTFNSSGSTYCPLAAFTRGENSEVAPIF